MHIAIPNCKYIKNWEFKPYRKGILRFTFNFSDPRTQRHKLNSQIWSYKKKNDGKSADVLFFPFPCSFHSIPSSFQCTFAGLCALLLSIVIHPLRFLSILPISLPKKPTRCQPEGFFFSLLLLFHFAQSISRHSFRISIWFYSKWQIMKWLSEAGFHRKIQDLFLICFRAIFLMIFELLESSNWALQSRIPKYAYWKDNQKFLPGHQLRICRDFYFHCFAFFQQILSISPMGSMITYLPNPWVGSV